MKIIQICGYKNSGKTSLSVGLIRELKREGFRVGALKHHGHPLEKTEGSAVDTGKMGVAGAETTALVQGSRMTINKKEAWLAEEAVTFFEDGDSYDWLVIEGFKASSYPKLILLRSISDWHELKGLANIKLVATPENLAGGLGGCRYAQVSRNDPDLVRQVIQRWEHII